jgi:hypothetical protein
MDGCQAKFRFVEMKKSPATVAAAVGENVILL